MGDKGINALPNVTVGSQEILAHKATAAGEAPAGVKVTGITLLLDSDTSLRLYFTCDGDAPTVAIDGVEVAPEPAGKKGNKYYVQAGPIGVAFLGNRHTVSIGGTYTAELDAYSYVYAALRDQDDQALEDVCKALWAYGEAFQQARD